MGENNENNEEGNNNNIAGFINVLNNLVQFCELYFDYE